MLDNNLGHYNNLNSVYNVPFFKLDIKYTMICYIILEHIPAVSLSKLNTLAWFCFLCCWQFSVNLDLKEGLYPTNTGKKKEEEEIAFLNVYTVENGFSFAQHHEIFPFKEAQAVNCVTFQELILGVCDLSKS